METLDVKIRIRERFCKKSDSCALRRVLVMSQQKEEKENGLSLNEIKELCISQGLKPSNNYYGTAIPQEIREKAGRAIFTVDCTERLTEGTNYTNCGSILATIEGRDLDLLTEEEKVAISLIRTQWILNNGS